MREGIDQYYRKRLNTRKRKAIIIGILSFILLLIIAFLIGRSQEQLIFLIGLSLVLPYLLFRLFNKGNRTWKKVLQSDPTPQHLSILEEYVQFFKDLEQEEKNYFLQRLRYFLSTKSITGIDCEIDEKIRVFIASSALIPVFSFPDFFYNNINEILVYPNSFDEEYTHSTEKERKRIAGMVGNGAMNRMMILSRKDLMKAFDNRIDADNVAIHEFVHLIDMTDGKIDGIPSVFLEQSFVIPWLGQMHKEMQKINRRRSDIDPYALTNPGEFLAVVSEYFFDSPEKFEKRHPDLYSSMKKIFKYNK